MHHEHGRMTAALALAVLTALPAFAVQPAAPKPPKANQSEAATAMATTVRKANRQLDAWATPRAKETVAPLAEPAANTAEVQVVRGRILEQEAKYDEALQTFQRAADLEPKSPVAHLYLAGVHERATRTDNARDHYQAAFNRATNWTIREPENAEAYYALGRGAQGLGRNDEARAAYDKSIALDPSNPLPYLYLGTIHYKQERWEPALAAFDKVMARNESVAFAYFFRGLTYGKLKKTGLMLNDLQHFVAMAPTAPEAETARAILSSVR